MEKVVQVYQASARIREGMGGVDQMVNELKGINVKPAQDTSDLVTPQIAPTYDQVNESSMKTLEQAVLTPTNRERVFDRERSLTEHASDVALATGSGIVGMAQMVQGAAARHALKGSQNFSQAAAIQDIAEEGLTTDERASKRVERFKNELGKLKSLDNVQNHFRDSRSDPLRLRTSVNNQEIEEARISRDVANKAKKDAGEWTNFDTAKEVGAQFSDATKSTLKRPSLIVDMALENLPDLAIGGLLGRAAATGAATKELATKVATSMGIAVTAAQEGLDNAQGMLLEVDKAEHAELMQQSPSYKDMIDSGLTEDEAKQKLMKQAYDLTFAISAGGSAVAGKVTGAGKVMGNLFMPKSSLGKTMAGAALSEYFQEGAESGIGQVAQNKAKQDYLNKYQELTEGVGKASAQGALAGGTLGSTITGASIAVGLTNAVGVKIGEAVAAEKARKPFADKVKLAVESGDTSVISDVRAPDFNLKEAITAFDSIAQKEGVDRQENLKKVSGVWNGFMSSRITELEIAINDASISNADLIKHTKTIKDSRKLVTELAPMMQKIFKDSMPSQDVESDITQAEAGDNDATQRVMGSIKLDPTVVNEEQAEKLLNSNISDNNKKIVQEALKYNRSLNTMDEVGGYVFKGGVDKQGKSWIGLEEYRTNITMAHLSGNADTVNRLTGMLDNFITGHSIKAKAAKQALDTKDPVVRGKILGAVGMETHRIVPTLVDNIHKEVDAMMALKAYLAEVTSTPYDDATKDNAEPESVETTETTVEEEVAQPVDVPQSKAQKLLKDIESGIPASEALDNQGITWSEAFDSISFDNNVADTPEPQTTDVRIVASDGSLINPEILKNDGFAFQKNILAKAGIEVTTQAEVDYIIENGYTPTEEVQQEPVQTKNNLRGNPNNVPRSAKPTLESEVTIGNSTYEIMSDGAVFNKRTGIKLTSDKSVRRVKDAQSKQTVKEDISNGSTTDNNSVTNSVSKESEQEQREVLTQTDVGSNAEFKSLAKKASSKQGRINLLKGIRSRLVKDVVGLKMFNQVVSALPKNFQVRVVKGTQAGVPKDIAKAFLDGQLGTAIGNTIYINDDTWDGFPEIIYHELDHIATMDKVFDAEKNKTKEYIELENIWKGLKNVDTSGMTPYQKSRYDYFMDGDKPTGNLINEMITIAKAEPEMSSWFKGQSPYKQGDSLWESIIQLVGKVLGVSDINAYTAIMSLHNGILGESNGVTRTDNTSDTISEPVAEQREVVELPEKDTLNDVAPIQSNKQFTINDVDTKRFPKLNREEAITNGDDLKSPWLLADGNLIHTYGDHIDFAESIDGDSDGYSAGFKVGAARVSYATADQADHAFVSVNIAEDGKLTPEQLSFISDFVKSNSAKILLVLGERGGQAGNEISIDNLRAKYTAEKTDISIALPTTESEMKEFFQTTNLLDAYFEPVNTDDKLTTNPLHSKPDYMAQVLADPNVVLEDTSLTELLPEQVKVLTEVANFHNQVKSLFTEAFLVKESHKYNDYMQYLANEDGTVNDNIIAALTLGIYNWLGTKAGDTIYNDASAINSIVSEDSDKEVPYELTKLLQFAGTTQQNVIQDLGKTALNQVGLKAKKDAPGNMQGNIVQALGTFSVVLMQQMGAVNIITLKGADIDIAKGNAINEATGLNDIPFVRVTTDETNMKMNPSITAPDSLKGTKGILEKVFGMESLSSGPSLEVPTKVVQTQKGTHMKVSKVVKNILKIHQARPNKVKKSMQSLVDNLSIDQLKSIIGFVEDTTNVQQYNRAGVEGKNAQIERSIESWNDFKNDLDTLDTPFYFSWEQWKNNRLGITSNTVNPQGDKFHRHMLTLEGQEQTLSKNNPEHMEYFKVAIAQGLDISIDKQTNETSIEELDILMNTGLMKSAIVELKLSLQNKEFDADVVTAAALKGKVHMHSLEALLAYAQMDMATDEFTTSYTLEVDGVTNGPAIATLQFAVGLDWEDIRKRLKRVSINMDNDTQEFGDWKSTPTNDDNYQAIGRLLENWLKDNVNEAQNVFMQLVVGNLTETIEGSDESKVVSAGRNIPKNPLMTSIYGAGERAIKATMGSMVVGKVYDYIQKQIDNSNKEEARKNLIDLMIALGGALPNGIINKGDVETLLANPIEFKLNRAAEFQLRKLGESTYGDGIWESIQTNYGEFMEKRTQVNNMMALTFQIFKAQFDYRVEQRTEEMIVEGKLHRGWQSLPKPELDKIMLGLLKSQPILNNYFSKLSGNLDEGLYVGKIRKGIKSGAGQSMYRTTQKYKNHKSANTFQRIDELVDGGVSPTVLAIQSNDAATMILTLKEAIVTNVHDAIYTSIPDLIKNTNDINNNFINVIKDYSIVEEANNTFQRALEQAKLFQEETGIDPTKNADFLEALQKVVPYVGDGKGDKTRPIVNSENYTEILDDRVKEYNDLVSEVNPKKELIIKRLTGVSQYYFEGGGINPNLDTDTTQLGSSGVTIDKGEFTDPAIELSGTNVEGVFNDMANVGTKKENDSHREYLKGHLRTVISKFMTPLALRIKDTLNQTYGAIEGSDIYMYTQVTGKGTNQSEAITNSGIDMSAQEVLVHELTHSVLRTGIEGSSIHKRDVKRIFEYVKRTGVVSIEDLMDENTDYETAKKTHDYIFTVRTDSVIDGKHYSNYLHEFATFAVTNEKVMAALSKGTVPSSFSKELLKGSWSDIVKNVVGAIFNFVLGKLTSTNSGKPLDKAMQDLALNLANIEGKSKNKILHAASSGLSYTTEALTKISTHIEKYATKAGNSNLLNNSDYRLVRAVGNVLKFRFAAIEKYIEYANLTLGAANKRQGMISALITEALGRTASTSAYHDLSREKQRALDHARNAIRANTKKALRNSFLNMELKSKHKVAITKAGLKTDISILLNVMPLDKVSKILTDTKALENEISILKYQLAMGKDSVFYVNAAQALGYYLATGNVTESNLLFNARNISKMIGTGVKVENPDKWVKIIDQLATLEALIHTQQTHKDALAEVINKDASGFQFFIDMAEYQKNYDAEHLFEGSEVSIIKGYTSELTDSNISIKTATEAQAISLKQQGYVRQAKLKRDPRNPNSADVYMWVNPYGGDMAYAAGLMALTSRQAKGSDTVDVRRATGSTSPQYSGALDTAELLRAKAHDTKRMVKIASKRPTANTASQMAPKFDTKGNVISYRYMMNERTKDELLKKQNNFDDVMGTMAANSLDKVNTSEFNHKIIDAMHDQYQEEVVRNPGAFLEVSPTSDDPVLRQYWMTLPEDAKDYARRTFMGSRIMVRKDVAQIVFGFRKLTASDLIKFEDTQNKVSQNALVQYAQHILGPKAAGRVRAAESMWQEYVKETKEFVVVKSGVVTLANAASNTLQLQLSGVPLDNIIKYQTEAYGAAHEYFKIVEELNDLEIRMNLGHKVNVQKVAELRHAKATNLVTELIEDGLLQTIVEDVEVEDSGYTHKNKLQQKVEKYTDKIPKLIKEEAKELYLSRDSETFKILNEAAQLSDFVARYALVKHLTSIGMGRNEAVGEAMDTFINYDMPTHPMVQYLNDMGVLWFTKYYFRVQKFIAKSFTNNPARTMMQAIMADASGMPTILDSLASPDNMMSRLHLPDNPVEMLGNSVWVQPL